MNKYKIKITTRDPTNYTHRRYVKSYTQSPCKKFEPLQLLGTHFLLFELPKSKDKSSYGRTMKVIKTKK